GGRLGGRGGGRLGRGGGGGGGGGRGGRGGGRCRGRGCHRRWGRRRAQRLEQRLGAFVAPVELEHPLEDLARRILLPQRQLGGREQILGAQKRMVARARNRIPEHAPRLVGAAVPQEQRALDIQRLR